MTTTTRVAEADIRARREKHHEADVVVVGAGIFGCAIAYGLANQGRSVLLLERWMTEPDRIVGELLQPGGIAALKKLGLGDCLEDIDSIPCYGYNVMYFGKESIIPYPPLDENGLVPSRWYGSTTEGEKQSGRGFHHGRFIMQLRRACMRHPNITVVETEVTNTICSEHSDQILGVETMTKNKETGKKTKDCFFGSLTIIADGYASKFRKQVTKSTPVVRSKFYALELIDCQLPTPGIAHVVIGTAFPVLLYQIGSRETRALIDVPNDLPAASPAAGGVRGYITNVVLPAMPPTIREATVRALADGQVIKSMPSSWLPPSPQKVNGMILLGDAMNMRHPLTGGGMTVAFNDALNLSDLLHPSRVPSLEDTAAVHSAMETLYWRRKRLTGVINLLAQALYSLFAADDRLLRALQRGCFGYFERNMTDGPAGLLGGLIASPVILFYHFFSVAFLSIWMHACDVIGNVFGIWKLPLAIVDAFLIIWKACVVFLPVLCREWFL